MSAKLLRLVSMKLLWPRGPGPKEFGTELHLINAIEAALKEWDDSSEAAIVAEPSQSPPGEGA